MSDDAGDLPAIEMDEVDEEELDPEQLDQAIQRILTRDEARIVSVVSVVLMAIGTVFSAGWLIIAWRAEQELSGTGGGVFGGLNGGQGADVLDRITVLIQLGSLLMLPLLVLGAGCGLRLYASRFITDDD